MIDIELKAIDQALAPQRLLREQLDRIFEPQRRLQEQFDRALSPYGRAHEQLERAFEPQRRLQEQLDRAFAPYSAVRDQFESALEPQRRLQEQLDNAFSAYGTVREQIDCALEPQRRLREQLDNVLAPYRMIQEDFDRYLSPLESYLDVTSIADIEVGDNGTLVVSGEAVTSDEIDSALADLPRQHTDPEEFYAQLSQKLQSVSVKWSTKTGHRVKALKCHNEVNDDNRNEKETGLYGRFQAGCRVAGD